MTTDPLLDDGREMSRFATLGRGPILMGMALLAGCRTQPPAPLPDELLVSFRTTPITIDGYLDEGAWRDATSPGSLRRSDGRAPARLRTEVHLTWDEESLYLGFECEDPDIISSYRNRDEPLYYQDVVEIFLDPDGDRLDYLEFEVSPAAVLFDASFSSRRQGMNLAFNPTVRAAVTVDGTLDARNDRDRRWTAEIAIPFLGMVGRGRLPPASGDRWRMNLFRIDKSGTLEEASSWKPTAGDFHDLDAFGSVRFVR